jgi:4-hydroxy-4-methyl-2-oxoglutarate aldolase
VTGGNGVVEEAPAQGTDELVERVRALDACVVSDALDALGLEGSVLGLFPIWEGARLVGRTVTVRLAEGPTPSDVAPVHLGARGIEACGPGDVIVVDNGGRTGMGGWGGLLSLAASLRGVGGVVVDGACRDVDEARELGFAAFARSGIQRTARARVHEVSTGEPVSIVGVSVEPGDIVIADGSGVVFVPASRAAEVVEKAEALTAREAGMQRALRSGVTVSKVLSGDYEHMLE